MNFSSITILKKINNKYDGVDEISLQDWTEYDECDCGGPLFKYHDVTSNVFVVKCGYVKETLDIKSRVWSSSKKQPCKFINIHKSDNPDYNNLILPKREKVVLDDPHKTLHNKLDSMFKFYFLAKKDITIQ
jgi:hypothetical protein